MGEAKMNGLDTLLQSSYIEYPAIWNTGLVVVLIVAVLVLIMWHAPNGFEDDAGFHYDEPEDL
jgi:hypothetical protein